MTILQVFKATLPSINYIFRNGKPAIFIQGKYATGVEAEVDELNDEISKGHPHIYVDKEEATVDSEMVDPIQALRAKIEAQIRAEMAAATDLSNDRGTSEVEKLKPSSSTDVMDAAAGGSGVGLAARLMNVTKK